MTSPVDVLRKATGEIGYYAPADPEPGSKYGRWLAALLNQAWLRGPSNRIWWCEIFTSWVYDGLAVIPGEPGFNCDTVRAAARAAGTLVDPRSAQPGDKVFFDWNGDGSLDHTGIVELNLGAAGLQTIEGNTSSGTGAHQSDGNGVWRRTRPWSVIAAVVRPQYVNAPVVVVPPPVTLPARKTYRDITPIQRALHASPDNVWGPDTDKRWRALVAASIYGGIHFPWGVKFTQNVVGTKEDNAWGAKSGAAHDVTVGLIQDAVGAHHDDIIGPETIGKVDAAHADSNHTV